jgi:ABC-2 type transport system ATP-binding protein
MLSTVLLPTKGRILVDGKPLDRKAAETKRKLALVTQEYSMRQDMTMEEVLEYQGRLYYMRKKEIKNKTSELLEFAGLIDFRRRTVRHLSGGMKRKLMICRALLTEPEILLLDEPTAGMDALARRQMWEMIRSLKSRNLTLLLTTHYIEEAQALCDRVAFLDQGKLDVVEEPLRLIEELGAFAIDMPSNEKMETTYYSERDSALEQLRKMPDNAVLRATTLEDVFVERIGHGV